MAQLTRASKKSVFMGDDTWIHLFPHSFTEYYAFDSFNNMDLNSNDDGVLKHLWQTIDSGNWSLLVGISSRFATLTLLSPAHFLGVDHAGHSFGQNHQVMQEKLGQMNNILRKITDVMKPDTFLVVMGDHGMTPDGNHGGSSDDETLSAFFAFRKVNGSQEFQDRTWLKECKVLLKQEDYTKGSLALNQIDATSTLAYLLGIPTPFNNLGAVIPNVAAMVKSAMPNEELGRELISVKALNAKDKMRYVMRVQAEFKKFTDEEVEELIARYSMFAEKAELLLRSESLLCEDLKELSKVHSSFEKRLLQVIRLKWNAFDDLAMTAGNIVMLILLVFLASLYVVTETRWSAARITVKGLILKYKPEIILSLLLSALVLAALICSGSPPEWVGLLIAGPLVLSIYGNTALGSRIVTSKISKSQLINGTLSILALTAFIFFGFTASAVSYLRNQGSED